MSSFSAVTTAIPIVGTGDRRIIGNGQTCEHSIAELNIFSSSQNSRLRAAFSCRNVVRRNSVSGDFRRSFVLRAMDQSAKVIHGENHSNNDVDDNNTGEMEDDTMHEAANHRHEPSGENKINDSSSDHGRRPKENVQEQAQAFADSIRSGTSMVSEQLETAGRDLMHTLDQTFGSSHHEDDDVLCKIVELRHEDLQEAYIEIDDGSAKESILL